MTRLQRKLGAVTQQTTAAVESALLFTLGSFRHWQFGTCGKHNAGLEILLPTPLSVPGMAASYLTWCCHAACNLPSTSSGTT